MSLLTEAQTAFAAWQAAEKATREAARDALSQAATAALSAVLHYKAADGTTVTRTLADLGLKRVHRDFVLEPPSGVVVWGDGIYHLGATLRDGVWEVRLMRQVDGAWERASRPLTSLADLGRALVEKPSA